MQKNTETNIMGTCVTTPELQVLPLPYLLHLFFLKKGKNARLKLYIIFPPLPSPECHVFPFQCLLLYFYYVITMYTILFIKTYANDITLH